ncbi:MULTISPECIES: aminoglycoside phosphotransferase family protein [unclassified Actinotalea]|uniref:aminoglycoside phosphotransferase family protein n=1 Tax=unclassified Actinotalea TaxID=2638618 RepID=UPI0015F6A902|nr:MULTISPECIES: aminoglycoside phosphotransferase family protein [unclassified Actinotalea]
MDPAFAVAVARAAGQTDGPVAAPDVAGGVNEVTVLGSGADRVVVRAPRPGQAVDLDLEAWCMRRAAEHGIGVPEVLWLGELDGRAAMVQRYVADVGLGRVPVAERWRLLGELGRRIAALPLTDAPAGLFSRFGRDLPAAWVAHVDHNLEALGPDDPLVGLGVYRAADRAPLRALLTEARDAPPSFGLTHGDLSPRNLRVPAQGGPVLLDWGSATAGPVPTTDLLHLLLRRSEVGDPDDTALAALAQGWGEEVDRRDTALSRLVSALDLTRWALEHAPDRVPEQVRVARRLVRRTLGSGSGSEAESEAAGGRH